MARITGLLLAGLVVLAGEGACIADNCPSTRPKCATSSADTLAKLSGAFSCIGTITKSGGNLVTGQLFEGSSDGKGNITGQKAENNNFATTAPTFENFTSHKATYCLNSDGTGYIFPVEAGACPLAFAIDDAEIEARVLGTSLKKATAILCHRQ